MVMLMVICHRLTLTVQFRIGKQIYASQSSFIHLSVYMHNFDDYHAPFVQHLLDTICDEFFNRSIAFFD